MRTQGFVYRPELDGVRAVAIVAVVIAHAKLWYPNLSTYWGARGVDLFFVLSGFLITSLLFHEHAGAGHIDRAKFYARRGIRLLPALAVALIIGAFVARALHGNGEGMLPYNKAVFAALLFEGNWFKWNLGILNHTWSLGLEEQYYLLWPLVMGLALRRGRSPLKFAAVLGVAAAFITALGSAYNHRLVSGIWQNADVAPWDRAGGILIGSALGLLVASDRTGRVKQLLRDRSLAAAAAVGVVAVISLTAHRPPNDITAYDFLIVLDVCFAILIGHLFVAESSPVSAIFRAQPLPAIGRISYGLYIFHWPIFSLIAAQKWPPLRGYLIALAATLVTAITSFVVIERPALRLKDRLRQKDAPPPARRRRPHVNRDVIRPARRGTAPRRTPSGPVRAA